MARVNLHNSNALMAAYHQSKTIPPRKHSDPGQAYVSQGRAVETVANLKNAAAERAQTDRERSQAYYRHKLGYDKPGITAKGVKRKAKRAYHKINPWD